MNDKAETILTAARELFLAKGYALASTDQIQQKAGVSKATIYAHYASKAGLFAAVIEQECQRSFNAEPETKLDTLPISEFLAIKGLRFLELLHSPASIGLFRIVIAESPRFPELGRAFFTAGPTDKIQRIKRNLDLAVQKGEITCPNTALAAEMFLQMLCGFDHLRELLNIPQDSSKEALQARVAFVVESFLRMLTLSN